MNVYAKLRKTSLVAALFLSQSCFSQVNSGVLSPNLKGFLKDYVGTDFKASVAVARLPLANKSTEELLAYLIGPGECGSGGCTLLILETDGNSFHILQEVSIVQLPVRVLSTSSFGHPDLSVITSGRAPATGYEAVLRYDGQHYPSNPSLAPAVRSSNIGKGKALITETSKKFSLN